MLGQGADGRPRNRRETKKRAYKRTAKKVHKLQKAAAALPQISEHDLLAFQSTHFADDSKPAEWFVDPEVATTFAWQPEDDLGYYSDGVKRTLSDANIEFFRALEVRQAEEESRKARENLGDPDCSNEDTRQHDTERPSDRAPATWQSRRRAEDIPYNERNKRHWEQYIQGEDAVEGSLTHRRIARELDDQKMEQVDMDY